MFSYLHHIGDFNKATRHLSRVERSVYRDLLDLYYETEKPLVNDRLKLCRLIIATRKDEVEAVSQVLSEFFHLTDRGFVQVRCELEIEKYFGFISDKSKAGKVSAEKRKAKRAEILASQSTGVEQVLNGCTTDEQQKLNTDPTDGQLTVNHVTSKPVNPLKDITPQSADHSLEIFDYWKMRMNHSKAKFDSKRQALINKALKLGYEAQDLIAAINGCAKSPYHMGTDGRNSTVYDDLGLILRDAEHIDKFMKLNSLPQAPSNSQGKFDPLAYMSSNRPQNSDLNGFNVIEDNLLLIRGVSDAN